MINDDVFEAYNNRLTANLTNIKTMTPAQLDRVKSIGTAAENLLKNKDFVLFIRQFQIESVDAQVDITGHTAEDNALRIAISNQLSGIESFITLLKRQVAIKNRVVTQQTEPNTDN
jgi:uncharacterized protein YpbB